MPAKRPNFLILCTDQQQSNSLGCAGNPIAQTPNIDALAARGLRFTRHHTPNQICCPARATMITGRYPRYHGMTTNGRTVVDGLPTLPGMLAEAGYHTHAVGKLHLQPIMADVALRFPESVPFWEAGLGRNWNGPYFGYRGVDFMIGESLLATEGGHYAQWLHDNHPAAVDLYQPESALAGPLPDLEEAWTTAVPEELHYNNWIADRAIDFLSDVDSDSPFMLFVSTPDPHHPFSPPLPWADQFDPEAMPLPKVVAGELDSMAPYINRPLSSDWIDNDAPMVEQGGMTITAGISNASMRKAIALTRGMEAMIDEAFGRVLEELERRGLTDNTVIVFTSDHGEFLGRHGLLHKGPPPYRDLTEVSYIMAGPGVPSGQVADGLTTHLDLMPTLLDLAGVEHHDLSLDGHSLRPLLEGEAWDRDALFLEYHARVNPDTYNHSIVTQDYRLTVYPTQSEWGELFCHTSDPGEHHNLFNDPAYRAPRDRLMQQLNDQFSAAPDAGTPLIAKW